jgi:hypothetical protein
MYPEISGEPLPMVMRYTGLQINDCRSSGNLFSIRIYKSSGVSPALSIKQESSASIKY